jgi:hypothetical protein
MHTCWEQNWESISVLAGLLEASWREVLRARFRPALLSSEAESPGRLPLRRDRASVGESPLLLCKSSDALLLPGSRAATKNGGG